MTVGDWNVRQKFDQRGLLFLIGEATAGGFMIVRVHEEKPNQATIVALDIDTVDAAVRKAEQLRKATMQ